VAERSVDPPETSAWSPKASPGPRDAKHRRLPERRDDRDREAPLHDQVERVRRIAAVDDDLERVWRRRSDGRPLGGRLADTDREASTASAEGALSRPADAPSMSTCGRTRLSQAGIHQHAAPASTSSAGASRSTVMAASATPTERPTPNCFTVGSSLRTKLPKTDIMISAAAVMTRAPAARPPAIASRDAAVGGAGDARSG
jgi:hypothetical protein